MDPAYVHFGHVVQSRKISACAYILVLHAHNLLRVQCTEKVANKPSVGKGYSSRSDAHAGSKCILYPGQAPTLSEVIENHVVVGKMFCQNVLLGTRLVPHGPSPKVRAYEAWGLRFVMLVPLSLRQ